MAWQKRKSTIDSHRVTCLIYIFLWQVDKLEQSENVRSEEEQKAEETPIVFSK